MQFYIACVILGLAFVLLGCAAWIVYKAWRDN